MTLTLKQVQKAGRFAWCRGAAEWGRAIYVPSVGIIEAYALVPDDIPGYDEQGCVVVDEARFMRFRSRDKWAHLPGCDCEYCH